MRQFLVVFMLACMLLGCGEPGGNTSSQTGDAAQSSTSDLAWANFHRALATCDQVSSAAAQEERNALLILAQTGNADEQGVRRVFKEGPLHDAVFKAIVTCRSVLPEFSVQDYNPEHSEIAITCKLGIMGEIQAFQNMIDGNYGENTKSILSKGLLNAKKCRSELKDLNDRSNLGDAAN